MIDDLPPGEYKLLIDGNEVFQGSVGAFRAGVNLAKLKQTPQLQQVLRVEKSLMLREALVMKLRSLAQCYHNWLWNLKDHTFEAEQRVLEEKLKVLRAREGGLSKYFISLIENYLKHAPDKESLTAKAAALYEQAYHDNKPMLHHYTVVRK